LQETSSQKLALLKSQFEQTKNSQQELRGIGEANAQKLIVQKNNLDELIHSNRSSDEIVLQSIDKLEHKTGKIQTELFNIQELTASACAESKPK